MSLTFEKWHGIGNDFVLIERVPVNLEECDLSELAQAVCKRTFGVGADGLLLAYSSDVADIRMVMLNPDGSEAEMCGNGLRCFAKWHHARVGGSGEYRIETGSGVLICQVVGEMVSVKMGDGVLLSEDFLSSVEIEGLTYDAQGVCMGNPHLVVFVPNELDIQTEKWGRNLEHHPAYHDRTNVHFLCKLADGSLRQVTWERGAGITLACGTGACACAVAARDYGWCGDSVLVHLPGGDLEISMEGQSVTMTGPAVHSFNGKWLGKRGCWPDEV
ncbi:MAG: diaminopimelate epimerase [Fimbriimonadaceae bacterium]